MAFFVLQEKPRSAVARSYGLFNLAIVFWAATYAVWQFMNVPEHAYVALKWTLFFGLWPNIAFIYFVFCIEGMNQRRWLILLGSIAVTVLFAGMDLKGVLFSSVGLRDVSGLWGTPTKWLGVCLIFWSLECLFAFIILLQTTRRADAKLRNRMYFVFLALLFGHIGAISNWPTWYGLKFPAELNVMVSVCSLILAYAVTRYQIMDMQIVIRGTVVYSTASACLFAIYFGVISVLTHGFEHFHTNPSLGSSAAAAIISALIFHPLRIRIQGWLDQQFPRQALNQVLLREATGTFVHEIKRPLTNMSLPAQLALQDVDQLQNEEHIRPQALERLRERLKFIVNESHDAAEKIDAIRNLSMGTEISKGSLNLAELLGRLVTMEKDRFKASHVIVETKIAAGLPTYVGNAGELEIALMNIICNATEAMADAPGQHRFYCALHYQTPVFELAFRDTGRGIAAQDLRRLFEPWFSSKRSQGMGLGLYLTQQIIHRHGGTITVESIQNQGTTFYIRLPQ